MPAQSDYRFEFSIPDGPAFDVVRFELTEALSQPFRLELELSSIQSTIDFDALLDKPASFTIARAGEPVRKVQGIVTAFEQGESGFRRTRYIAVVEPSLVRLDLRRNSRIFQCKAVPMILKALLDEQRVQGTFATAREHLEREYCVQHREQDLDFYQRLAGEEGLVYYFDASTDSRLVLTDALPAGPSLSGRGQDTGTVTYQPNLGGDAAEPRLWRFSYRKQLASTRASQRDYTFKNPRYDLQQQSNARDGVGDYENYDAPGRYKRDEAGKPFTQTRLNGLRNQSSQAELEGDDARLWPGLAFALAEHPSAALNRDWRVVALSHQGEQSSGQEEESFGSEQGSRYLCRGRVVAADCDWKPAPLPHPVMDGLQVAHVVGPPGEEIHTDEHGRVMVWFPWDREGPKENSTCWIRVSQGWAGASYGMQMLPRIGHEVLVSFLDGDPDQPIVTGRSYHAANRPPYALPQHKTRSTWKSQTHKGEGSNEIRFEDEKGQEEVYIHAQRDKNIVVEHDETQAIGNDQAIAVARDRITQIGRDESNTIGRDRKEHIRQDTFVTIDRNEIRKIGNSQKEEITASRSVNMGENDDLIIEGIQTIQVNTSIRTLTPTYQLQGSERILIRGPAGSVLLDGSGVTISAPTIHLRGIVNIQSPASDQVAAIEAAIQQGTPLVEECPLRSEEQA